MHVTIIFKNVIVMIILKNMALHYILMAHPVPHMTFYFGFCSVSDR